jgi:hypothetical protein
MVIPGKFKYYSVLILSLNLFFGFSYSQEQIRIMSYNILRYPNTANDAPPNDSIIVVDTTARNPYFRKTISSVSPDILVVEEIYRRVDAEAFLNNVMNSFGETYTLTFWGTWSDDNAVYFKSSKFNVIDSAEVVVLGGGHCNSLFTLYHTQTRDTLKIFAVHLFASESETANRKIEADSIRVHSDAFASGTYFIALGDFNTFKGTETGFTALLDQTNSGYFIDPLNLQDSTNWSANWLTAFNTFCTRAGPGDYLGGGSESGLDERFDILLNSQSIVDSGGITYIADSFVEFGNDGLHNNIDINDNGSTSLPNQAVSQTIADALYYASDHLPVYADFYFCSPAPGNIVFTQVGSDNDDVIEFITLHDRMDLTKLKITNNALDINKNFGTGGGTFDLSNTSWKDVPGGTFVRLGSNLTNDNDPSDRILQYDGTGSGTLPSLGGVNGDQLIAYTGSSSAPYFISGITWGNDGWRTGPGDSYAPGTPSDIALGASSNYYFSGSVNGDADVTRTALINSSNWSSYAGGTYNDLTSTIGGAALPVELVFFTGTLNGNGIQLHWKTETEVDNYGFEIERSTKYADWILLGFIEGHGNSNSPKYYHFTDKDIGKADVYYYRLKQIDNNGTYEYSDLITVEVVVPEQFYLSQNYPNPFNPATRIDFTLPEKALVSLSVYNILGELVLQLANEEKPAGKYSVDFDASNLPGGVYIYRLKTPAFTQNRKMTLIK